MAMLFKKASDGIPVNSLKYLLHRHMAGWDAPRSLKTIHASELTKEAGFCPRYVALHDKLQPKHQGSWITTSERMTYDIGHMVQARVIDYLADMNKAVCHWRCYGCHWLHEFTTRPTTCSKCASRGFRAEEVRFTSAVSGASGGIDILAQLGEGKLTTVEIKTMAPDAFKELVAPLAEHKQRTSLYLRLIAESDHNWSNLVATNKAVILYVSKGGFGVQDEQPKKWQLTDRFSPFKEFEVKRDDSLTDEPTRRAVVVKQFRAGNVGMPQGICVTAMSKRASNCRLKAQCFSGEFPPQYDWKGEKV